MFSKSFVFFALDNITIFLVYKLRFYILKNYYFKLDLSEVSRPLLNDLLKAALTIYLFI